MPYIGHNPTNAGSFIEIDDFSSTFNGAGDNGTDVVAFTLQVGGVDITPNTANVLVMLDGVLQQPPAAYSISGSTLTFTEAPASGTDLYAVLIGQSASVGQGTITAAELAISGNGTNNQLLKTDGDGTFSYINQNTVTASTAATLATARAINGVNFDGSAAITVTAAAGTLSGNTLASGVTASSLTSLSTALVGNGSAGSPSHSFSNNADSGMYSPADNQLGLASGGSQALVFGGDQSATFYGDVQISGTTPTLLIGDDGAEDTRLQFLGNALDIHIGVDDSNDKFTIGKGSALGTTTFITIDENGLVTLPDNWLTVNGKATISPSISGDYAMFVNQQNGAGWGLRVAGGTDNDDYIIRAQNGSGNDKFVVKSGGNIVLGDDKLLVNTTGQTNINVAAISGWGATVHNAYNSDSDVYVYLGYANSSGRNSGMNITMDDANSGEYLMSLNSDSVERFKIDGTGQATLKNDLTIFTGNSGSGKVSYNQLHIETSSTSNGMAFMGPNGCTHHMFFSAPKDNAANYIRCYVDATNANDWMGFTVGNSEIMRLGAGRVGIGTGADTRHAKLHLQETVNGQEAIYVNHTLSGGQAQIVFKTLGSTRGSITSDNSPSGTAYNQSSDERLKENIVEVNNALSIINKIPVKQFNWKEDESNTPVIGYIGQELIKEYPQAVSVVKTSEYDDYHMVDQSKMVAVLMKAVQELSAKVTALESA